MGNHVSRKWTQRSRWPTQVTLPSPHGRRWMVDNSSPNSGPTSQKMLIWHWVHVNDSLTSPCIWSTHSNSLLVWFIYTSHWTCPRLSSSFTSTNRFSSGVLGKGTTALLFCFVLFFKPKSDHRPGLFLSLTTSNQSSNSQGYQKSFHFSLYLGPHLSLDRHPSSPEILWCLLMGPLQPCLSTSNLFSILETKRPTNKSFLIIALLYPKSNTGFPPPLACSL